MMRFKCVFVMALVAALSVVSGVFAASPIIFYTDIIAGPKTGGENNNGCYLTITGLNFGTPSAGLPPSSTHVYINGVEVAAYKYLGQGRGRPDTWQLGVQIGSAVSSGAITVTTPDGTATAPENFTVNSANIVFISPSGSDSTGTGTFASPYKTPNKVLARATGAFSAGTHIVIRGGTYLLTAADANIYNSRWLYMGLNGDGGGVYGGTSTANACTVMGYPGETVTVDWGTNTSYVGIMSVATANYDYWVFSNITFDIKNAQIAVMQACDNPVSAPNPATNQTHTNYSRWVNLTITNALSGCTSEGGYNAFDIMSADYSKFYGLDIGNQANTAAADCPSHVFYYAFHRKDSEIAYCYFHDMPYGQRGVLQIAGDGADVYYTHNTNLRIHDNYFKNLAGGAILCNLGSYQEKIYNNIIEDVAKGSSSGTGWTAVFLRGGASTAGDYEFYNNTIYSSVRDKSQGLIQMGFSPGGTMPNSVTAYNNIIYAKDTATPYYTINHASFDPAARCTFNNNLYYGSTAYNNRASSSYPAYGNIPGGALTSWEGASSLPSSNPSFTALGSSDFTLSAGSPAINVGRVLNSPYNVDYRGIARGAQFDMGAMEYAAETDTTPSTLSGVSLSGATLR